MKNKRLISLVLAFFMMVSVAFTGGNLSAKAEEKSFESKTSEATLEEKKTLNDYIVKQFGTLENYDRTLAALQKNGQVVTDDNMPQYTSVHPDDQVRIVVELSEKSAVEMAKDAGVPLKQANMFSNKISLKQKSVIDNVKAIGKVRHTYQNLLNGFSAVVKFKDINMVRSLPGVKTVAVAKQYYPDMNTAVDFTQAKTVWEKAGLKGEGIVVAIIDTGIDYRHKDMKSIDTSKVKYKKEDIDALIGKNGAKGRYFTEKVPYGYNFADLNNEVIDRSGSMHGMHVGGIVAANGGIVGVAPQAQLLAMKVFSNNPLQKSGFNDDIAAGVEEAWKMGADVINMSLGSPSGFLSEADPEQKAIKNATNSGVVVVVSAGNSAHSTDGKDLPYEKDCDISTLGDPGLYPDTLQVASSENRYRVLPGLEYKSGEKSGMIPFNVTDDAINPNTRLKEEYDIVDCGVGRTQDFAEKELNGKIALVKRGGLNADGKKISFVDKQLNAQNFGALGIIVYNEDKNDEYMNMATDEKITIPAVFISNTDGNLLKDLASKGIKVFFRGRDTKIPNTNNAQMSDFTSWGTSPDLRFKPEVTAPGGHIYSTVNDDRYLDMSGTSMAAPHASGAVALVVQYLKNKVPELKGTREFVNLAKTLTINTAKPLIEKETLLPYLTRRQGAGIVQINDAITTNVYAVDKNGSAAMALGEVGNATSFAITLHNFGKEDLEFSPVDKYGVLTNAISNDEKPRLLPKTAKLEGAEIIFDKASVKVPAGRTATVTATLKISRKPMNQFAEGFITFESKDLKNPNIGVAYMGFFGKWDEPRIFDSPKWEDDSFYKCTTLTEGKSFLNDRTFGKINRMAFSPNNDDIQDEVYPLVSLLRNAKNVNVRVLDKDKSIIRVLSDDSDVRRNNGRQEFPFYYNPSWGWDGTAYNEATSKYEALPEGQYYISVAGKVDYPGAREQEITMPIRIDNTVPTLNPVLTKLEGNKYNVKFNANDNMGVCYKMVIINGDYTKPLAVTDEYDDFSFVIPSGNNLISVVAADFAGNLSEKVDYYINNTFVDIGSVISEGVSDSLAALSHPDWEKAFSFVNKTNFEFEYVVNNLFTGLGKFRIILDDKVNENLPFTGSYKVDNLSDGEHKISFELVGNDGKVIATRMHRFLVDTKAPVVNLIDPVLSNTNEAIKLQNGESEYTIKFKAEDENLAGASVDGRIIEPVNGVYTGKVFFFSYDTMPAEKIVRAIDFAGNITDIIVKFDTRSDKPIIKVTAPKENSTLGGCSFNVSGNISNVSNTGRTMNVNVNGQVVMARKNYDETYGFYTTTTVDGYGNKTINISVEDESGAKAEKAVKVEISPITVGEMFTTTAPAMKLDYKLAADCKDLDHVNVTVNAEDKVNNQKNESIELNNLSYGINILKLDAVRADESIITRSIVKINVDNEVPKFLRLIDGNKKEIKSGTVVETNKLKLSGFLAEAVSYVKINDVVQKIENAGMLEKDKMYYFNSGEFDLVEGLNNIRIEMQDLAGCTNNSIMKVIKDTKAPELEVIDLATNEKIADEINTNKDSYTLKIKAKDGVGYRLIVNGNQLLSAMTDDYTGEDTLREVEYPVEIKYGENTVTVEAVDTLGHSTIKIIKLNKDIDQPMITIQSTTIAANKVVIKGKAYKLIKLMDKELNKEIPIKEDGTFIYERELNGYCKNMLITITGYNEEGKEVTPQVVNVNNPEFNAPVVVIDSPIDNSMIEGKSVIVKGKVTDESGVVLTINDEKVTLNSDGSFEYNALFNEYGAKTIVVKATDDFGIVTEKVIHINLIQPVTPPVVVPPIYYPPIVIAPFVQKIEITADSNELFAGNSTLVKVIAKYSDGKNVDITDKASFSCDHGTVENGVYKSADNYSGKAVIKATYEGVRAEIEITIKESTVSEITAKADSNVAYLGKSVKLNLEGKKADGKTVDLTNKAAWTCDHGTIKDGVYQAPSDYTGKVVIKATFEGKESVVEITVKENTIKELKLTTDKNTVVAGKTVKLNVIAKYDDGSTKNVTDKVEWQLTNVNLGKIEKGIFTSKLAGKVNILAKFENLSTNQVTIAITKPVVVSKKVVMVTGNKISIRAKMTTASKRLGTVKRGIKLEYLGTFKGWYKVKYNGKIAYISSRYSKIVLVK